jgi:hypothetical protein
MVVPSIIMACIMLVLNFVPAMLISSPNRYNYAQSIIFATLFFGVWFYKIKSDLDFQDAHKMDLQEKVYKSTYRAKYREIRKYHDPSLYVVVDNNKLMNDELMQRDFSAMLMRILTVDALMVLLFNYYGYKHVRPFKGYYKKKIILYTVFFLFCVGVEFFNYFLLY